MPADKASVRKWIVVVLPASSVAVSTGRVLPVSFQGSLNRQNQVPGRAPGKGCPAKNWPPISTPERTTPADWR